MANRLARETSPYLLQHAENPVDWYPWGEEALARARTEHKPILLSIGYSACHWCHVMAHESFENPDTAGLMNANFINIKVDREERPDLDSLYMAAVQALTGHGGWPLTVFLTPDGRPFYGGTYFPPEDRHGMPAFKKILNAVATAFRERPDDVTRTAGQLVSALDEGSFAGKSSPLKPDWLEKAHQSLSNSFDRVNAGFGSAPKFPQPLVLDFLLRYHRRTGNMPALGLVERTLEAMYRGGMYDHLGGGFHRYATDAAWQVPHFEKMLYDNALLSRVYLHAFQHTGNPIYRFVAEDIINYVLREMTDPATGGFYSSQDADSEGWEGRYYVWDTAEIIAALGDDNGAAFNRLYGVTPEGNFEERNILHLVGDFSAGAAAQAQVQRAQLRRSREKRVPPAKDTKILASWNGMMLEALAEAACVLKNPIYLAAAEKNAAFISASLACNGLLRHTAAVNLGFLEDYSQLIEGLLWLHRSTLNPGWLRSALDLTEKMVELFWDEDAAIFYDTAVGSSDLFKRPRTNQDGAVPSGSATAALMLLKVARINDDPQYQQIAERALAGVGEHMAAYPLGFGQWLAALDFYFGPSQEVAIISKMSDPAGLALAQAVCARWRPNTIVAGAGPTPEPALARLPIFKDRPQLQGEATAYVCRDFNCFPPVVSPQELEGLLE